MSILLDHVGDLGDTMKNSGVVLSAKFTTDLRQAGRCHVLTDIHCNLSWEGDLANIGFRFQVGDAETEVIGNNFLNRRDRG